MAWWVPHLGWLLFLISLLTRKLSVNKRVDELVRKERSKFNNSLKELEHTYEEKTQKAIQDERERCKSECSKLNNSHKELKRTYEEKTRKAIQDERERCKSEQELLKAKYNLKIEKLCSEFELLNCENEPQSYEQFYSDVADSLLEWDDNLSELQDQINKRETDLAQRESMLIKSEKDIQIATVESTTRMIEKILKYNPYSFNPVYDLLVNSDYRQTGGRILRAISEPMSFPYGIDVSAKIRSANSENVYRVSLVNCNCDDFRRHKNPCKHMIRLGYETGVLASVDVSDKLCDLSSHLGGYERVAQEAKRENEKLRKYKRDIGKIISSGSHKYPWLAKLFAEYEYIYDGRLEEELRNRKRPASKARIEIKQIKKEKRGLIAKCKSLEYQLNYYESLFPWLAELQDSDPKEIYTYLISDTAQKAEYDSVRRWLSPVEYKNLPDVEKYQLALDRWIRKKRSNWQAGIDYERYVGYLYEMKGLRVDFPGVLLGKEDMGRDLIVSSPHGVDVIQCKRWAAGKTIHEKHVFQLFGSVVQLRIKDKQSDVSGILYTTASLSDVARSCANELGIKIFENHVFEQDYPRIKCNVSKTGELIYHLPFDQQYDRVRIKPFKGETYVATVKEAEALGFRRAMRHKYNKP